MFELINVKTHCKCSITGKNLKPGDAAYYCHESKNLIDAAYYESANNKQGARKLINASEYFKRHQKLNK